MQTRAALPRVGLLPEGQPDAGGPPTFGSPQPIQQADRPNGLPRHLEREIAQRRAAEENSAYAPENDEHIDVPSRLYDYLWPLAFWSFVLLNLGATFNVVISMLAQYNVWAHLNVSIISMGSVAMMAVIYKWVIRGPEGLPWHHHKR